MLLDLRSMSKITRRKFLGLAALTLPAALGADARFIEPTSLRVTKLNLPGGPGNCRFVHFTDLHYKGDTTYATEVVRTINELAPEFVCFTGDLVEEARFAPEALGFIQRIRAPVYGSPGNHDYWSHVSFAEFERVFAATDSCQSSLLESVSWKYGWKPMATGIASLLRLSILVRTSSAPSCTR